MTFDEFLSVLPPVDQPKHPIQPTAAAWAAYRSEPNPRFVPPPLRDTAQADPSGVSVIILSAPGAVGKSTTGKEIVRLTGAPFIDLARRKVGSDGAAGLVLNAFGPQGVASALEALGNGTLCLVIDSLDETRLGSGEANFDAFLEDLSALFKESRPAPAAVLLARMDTADWIELLLTEYGVGVARYTIDFFDHLAARRFVISYVNNPTLTAGQPFTQALDGLLQGIRTAVEGQPDQESLTRSVLGYAPVLEVVGRYLLDEENRRNYYRLLQALQQDAREWELLLQVAEALLVREQEKVSEQANAKLRDLADRWAQWDRLYLPDEQVLRLQAKRFGLPNPPLPADLPPALRDSYEAVVRQALTDHPFLGSVDGLHPIFGEYLYARLLSDAPGLTAEQSAHGREVLKGGSYLPTRALGRFVHALTGRHGPPSVRSADFGFIYESFLSDQEKPGDVSLTLRSLGAADHRDAAIEARGAALNFAVTADSGPVWLWRRLTHASVSIQSDVQLGLATGEFRLGPNVYVECGALRCPSELLVYLGGDSEAEEVVLVAETFEPMARPPAIRGSRFFVRGPTVPWPWSTYAQVEVPPPSATPQVTEAYNHLARVLLWFQARGHEEIARVDDLVEHAAAGGTSMAKQVIDYCVAKGLIERRDRMYMLRDDVIASYGINYTDLKRRTLRQPVVELLSQFLNERRA